MKEGIFTDYDSEFEEKARIFFNKMENSSQFINIINLIAKETNILNNKSYKIDFFLSPLKLQENKIPLRTFENFRLFFKINKLINISKHSRNNLYTLEDSLIYTLLRYREEIIEILKQKQITPFIQDALMENHDKRFKKYKSKK
jgi:hypothetical protein